MEAEELPNLKRGYKGLCGARLETTFYPTHQVTICEARRNAIIYTFQEPPYDIPSIACLGCRVLKKMKKSNKPKP